MRGKNPRKTNWPSHRGRRVEARWLREINESIRKHALREGDESKQTNDSVDIQVDKFFENAEKQATSAKNESLDWRSTTRRLLEADDDEETGDEDKGEEQAPQLQLKTIDDIDVETFAAEVAKLIQDFETFIETRSTIVRRAVNFLSEKYDESVRDTVVSILRDTEGLSPDQTEQEIHDDDYEPPFAARSGPS